MPQEEALFTKPTFINPASTREQGDTETRGAQRTQPCPASEANARTQPQKDPRTSCPSPPSPHAQAHEWLCCGGPLSPPHPLVAQLQLEAPLTLLKVFMTFSHLKYGPLPRTGRRRRVPANLLIYKSIWQGTINSFLPAACAEGGYLPPREGRRVPSSAHALPC